MASVAELVARLEPEARNAAPSQDLSAAQERLFAASDPEAQQAVLQDWISSNQPCLFGRIAAKRNLLSFCVLNEADLQADDRVIRDTIQSARAAWWSRGWEGKASGFIIAVVSPTVAAAAADENLLRLAQKICSLYLLQDVQPNTVCHDELFLEKPGYARRGWRWLVGVNFFAAQGDRRWWHDHRIPGGLAFSMNSVGHMAKAGAIHAEMLELDNRIGIEAEEWELTHVDSLEKSLILAMRTISKAASAISGRATELLPAGAVEAPLPCPVELPAELRDKNHCTYSGWYDTDTTLPAEYFRSDVGRPDDVESRLLDFTYLFDRDSEDYLKMGDGLAIRDDETSSVPSHSKIARAQATEILVDDQPGLAAAIGRPLGT